MMRVSLRGAKRRSNLGGIASLRSQWQYLLPLYHYPKWQLTGLLIFPGHMFHTHPLSPSSMNNYCIDQHRLVAVNFRIFRIRYSQGLGLHIVMYMQDRYTYSLRIVYSLPKLYRRAWLFSGNYPYEQSQSLSPAFALRKSWHIIRNRYNVPTSA